MLGAPGEWPLASGFMSIPSADGSLWIIGLSFIVSPLQSQGHNPKTRSEHTAV